MPINPDLYDYTIRVTDKIRLEKQAVEEAKKIKAAEREKKIKDLKAKSRRYK